MITTKTGKKMPYPELRGSLAHIVYPAWAEVKVDGEFNWFFSTGDPESAYFVNKSGKERVSELSRRCAILFKKEPVTLLGELIWPPGKKGDLYEFLKHQYDEGLHFVVFDIVSYKGVDLKQKPFIDRKELLMNLFIRTKGKITGRGKTVQNKEEVEAYFKEIIRRGWEGIVIKSLNGKLVFGPCDWVKCKQKDENNLQIWTIDNIKERIEVRMPLAGGGGFRAVGVKVCNKDKVGLKAGMMVKIEHQGVLSGGGLRHPVFRGVA